MCLDKDFGMWLVVSAQRPAPVWSAWGYLFGQQCLGEAVIRNSGLTRALLASNLARAFVAPVLGSVPWP